MVDLKINVFNIPFTTFQFILKKVFYNFQYYNSFYNEKCNFMKIFHIPTMITNSYFFQK